MLGQRKSETNLHKIKSMKEHFCGETISLQGHCAGPRTVPCGHFPLTTCVRQRSRDEPLGSADGEAGAADKWRGTAADKQNARPRR